MTLIFLGTENDDLGSTDFNSGFPGCILIPNINPKHTLKIDVSTKYTIVRMATFLFLLISKLAAPENKD